MRKGLLISAGIILVVVMALVLYVRVLLQRSLPQTEGELILPGLSHTVEITYDKMGIPQIWAETEMDGYLALGYLHAADRLFQMDLTRRVAKGRLAEFFGGTVLDFDRLQRKVGHHRMAEAQLDYLSPTNNNRLQAYADGINMYVSHCDALPLEYLLLGKEFEPWTVFDALCVVSFQTWFSDFLQNPDQVYLKMAEEIGPERARSLIRDYPEWAPLTVPQPETSAGVRQQFQQHVARYLLGTGHLPFLMSTASNSWVVSPDHSESGAAMLASDPHLELSRLPQFWYYAGLHIKEKDTDVLGITTPGLPFFVMGHNRRVAWAFTVGGIDVTEYYIEKINPADSSQYLTPDGWASFIPFEEIIRVDGSKNDTLNVKMTRHGPVLVTNDSLGRVYSFRWAGFDMDLNTAVASGFRLMETADFTGFRKTVTSFGALDANWTYADSAGNIGYQLGTPLPVRPEKLGILPAPGWDEAYDWLGYYPLEKTPHDYNPEQGWLATCNNKQDDANLEYDLQGYFAADRIVRITELLRSKEMFSAKDMQSWQLDDVDTYMLRWKEKLLPVLRDNGYDETASILENWDGRVSEESGATAIIRLFLYYYKNLILEDELGDLTERVNYRWVETLFDEGDSAWFDDVRTESRVEGKADIFRMAMDTTLKRVGDKTWGDFNYLSMEHPLAVVPVVSALLNLRNGPFPWGGTKGALNASFLEEKGDGTFRTIVGPSWRFVIDFSDADAATMVLPAGNSGNPMSDHFMDFFELWRNGQRWNVPVSYEKVSSLAVSRLYLKPENTKE